MKEEVKNYIKNETGVSVIITFLMNGMISSLIHHMEKEISCDLISVAIDLLLTILSITVLVTLFSSASVRKNSAYVVFEINGKWMKRLKALLRKPMPFALVTGLATTIVVFLVTASAITLFSILSISFWLYILIKCVFTSSIAGYFTVLVLRLGFSSNALNTKIL